MYCEWRCGSWRRSNLADQPPNPDEAVGPPKSGGRTKSRYSVVATPEYKVWMKLFMEHLKVAEVSDVYREGVKRYAEAVGFRLPPPR